jgi:hypothetical protein
MHSCVTAVRQSAKQNIDSFNCSLPIAEPINYTSVVVVISIVLFIFSPCSSRALILPSAFSLATRNKITTTATVSRLQSRNPVIETSRMRGHVERLLRGVA